MKHMKSLLVLLATLVPAFGGTITTITLCQSGNCSVSRSYADFSPTNVLEARAAPPITEPCFPVQGCVNQNTAEVDVSFYTLGPARPGFLDLTFRDDLEYGGNVLGPYITPGGRVSGEGGTLFSWSCFACSQHVFIPITIGAGGVLDIYAIGADTGGFLWDVSGSASFTAQVRDGSTTGPTVLLFSAPEPAKEALIGLVLLFGLRIYRRSREDGHMRSSKQ
jgi:hypothetical protein